MYSSSKNYLRLNFYLKILTNVLLLKKSENNEKSKGADSR